MSAANGFEYRRHLLGADNPAITDVIIKNSETIKKGHLITLESGFAADVDGGTERVFGVCVGFTTSKGIPLPNAVSGDDYDGTYTSGGIGVEQYVATADNQTDKQVKVKVIADPFALFIADADGNLVAADEYLFLTADDGLNPDQTGTRSATVGQVQLWQRDPDNESDASKGLWKIANWQGEAWEPET